MFPIGSFNIPVGNRLNASQLGSTVKNRLGILGTRIPAQAEAVIIYQYTRTFWAALRAASILQVDIQTKVRQIQELLENSELGK